jgi:hypothetical protein
MKRRFSFTTNLIIVISSIFLMGAVTQQQSTNKDSTRFPAIDKTKVTPYYSGNTTIIPSSAMGNYATTTIMPCPGDPSRTLNSTGWPTAPICPNINGVLPANSTVVTGGATITDPRVAGRTYPATSSTLSAGTNPYCPNVCSVTRGTTPDSGITAPTETGPFSNVQEPICPTGYYAVSVFNSQPDISYVSTPQAAEYPIPTVTQYYKYKNLAGGSCGPTGGTGQYDSGCLDAPWNGATGNISWNAGALYGSPAQVYSNMNGISIPNGAASAVVFYDDVSVNQNTFYPSTYSSCSGSGLGANGNGDCSDSAGGLVGLNCSYAVGFKVKFDVFFHFAQCTLPPGYYTSATNYRPISTVCARIIPIYQH